MEYCINPDSDEPIFLLDAGIGRDEENPNDRYIDGDLFARELLQMDSQGKKRIQIWINSTGGNVFQGMAIYGASLMTKTKVDTVCYGCAYSIAGVIFQAGRKRSMLDYSTLMYHDAYVEGGGESKGLNSINESIATMVSKRSWKDEEAVKKMMSLTTFISASEALDSDLCDEVLSSDKLNIPRKELADASARWQYAEGIKNKLIPQNSKNKMDKVAICTILGLDPNTTSDADALKALQTAQNKLKEAENGRAIVNEKALQEAEAKVKAAEEARIKAEADLAAMNKAKADADAAAAVAKSREEAKNKILEKAKNKGLEFNDKQVENFVNLAVATENGTDAVIETIDAIPSKKTAPKFDKPNPVNDGKASFKLGADGGVADTSDMVAFMNSSKLSKAKARFTPNENGL